MTRSKNTGLFFGSFNPVHLGHLAIAGYMAEFTDMDEVWFVVSPQSPVKKKEQMLDGRQRLMMLNLAIENNPRLRATDIEFSLPLPSYTIHTLLHLKEKYPAREFSLIMGADNLAGLHRWKNHEQILGNYKIYVYPRPGSDAGIYGDHPAVIFTEAPLMEISASFIRNAVKEGRDVSFLMPEAAYNYMREMHFYEK